MKKLFPQSEKVILEALVPTARKDTVSLECFYVLLGLCHECQEVFQKTFNNFPAEIPKSEMAAALSTFSRFWANKLFWDCVLALDPNGELLAYIANVMTPEHFHELSHIQFDPRYISQVQEVLENEIFKDVIS